jgi:hypothetical protein
MIGDTNRQASLFFFAFAKEVSAHQGRLSE